MPPRQMSPPQVSLRQMLLSPGPDLDGFRRAVRALVAAEVPPEGVVWNATDSPGLFGAVAVPDAPLLALPRAVAELVDMVVRHRAAERHALLYQLIWRVLHGERALLEVGSDPLVHRLGRMHQEVRRDRYKMQAYVRFRRTEDPDHGERLVAWYEPDHYVVDAAAPFFVDRFTALRWSILTPLGSVHWDRETLVAGPAARREDAPEGDSLEAAWRAYYESTFNPARTNPKAMLAQMPKKNWRNMPETAAIPGMLAGAPTWVREMVEREAAAPAKRMPARAVAALAEQGPKSLGELNALIAAAAPMVEGGTRAVLGEGPTGGVIAFVGEQPGDQEDLAGRPFVGPAGQLFDRALEAAGIDRAGAYVTNAVKHFKFTRRGKRRIHQSPSNAEVKRYRWWLIKELELVQPRLVVALGATATLALAGRALPIQQNRGPAAFGAWKGYITVHPSYMLRLIDDDVRALECRRFVDDLGRAREAADFAGAAAVGA